MPDVCFYVMNGDICSMKTMLVSDKNRIVRDHGVKLIMCFICILDIVFFRRKRGSEKLLIVILC